MSARLVLGLDVGGTSTRALAADAASGQRLGIGRASGGNPIARGVSRAAENIGAAMREALAGHDAGEVEACVVGMAGESKVAAEPGTAAVFAALWQAVGLRCEVRIVSDVAAAFAAGTPESDGSVLIAGTGAVAAEMVGRRPCRWRDGNGWLLGDDGSGFWIGRQAVRAALAALDGSGPRSALLHNVIAAYLDPIPKPPEGGEPGETRFLASALIAAVNERPPVDLAALVPRVLAGAAAADPVAQHVLAEAARLLVAALCHIREPGDTTPIVLAGGVLQPGMHVDLLVRAALAETWPDAPVHAATDGAAGAAWLAALTQAPDPALHAQLMAEGGTGDARTRLG
ncbi:N-acetylglucosamine kinase [Actinospica robiniae]|uniref:N-acetylglucosamine kinase n=1 Tax=Actinospica robiniae TaxID=304901 RepID=UPI00042221F9|nr:BadF/BadG/BcrA/BcrD ATPase family protein [Actinospica robiniae]